MKAWLAVLLVLAPRTGLASGGGYGTELILFALIAALVGLIVIFELAQRIAASLRKALSRPEVRITRDFCTHSTEEQRWLLSNTWCDNCAVADLGMTDPVEYEVDGHIFVEGRCVKCRSIMRSKINIVEATQ